VSYLLLSPGGIWFFIAEYVVIRLEGGRQAVRALAAIGLSPVSWVGFIAISRLILLLVSVYDS
jgi:hypothetical protein